MKIAKIVWNILSVVCVLWVLLGGGVLIYGKLISEQQYREDPVKWATAFAVALDSQEPRFFPVYREELLKHIKRVNPACTEEVLFAKQLAK